MLAFLVGSLAGYSTAGAAEDVVAAYRAKPIAVDFLGGVALNGGLPAISVETSTFNMAELALLPRIYSPEPEFNSAALLLDAELRTGSIEPSEISVSRPRKPTAARNSGAFGSVRIGIGTFPTADRWKRVYATLQKCKPGATCDKAEELLGIIVKQAAPKRFMAKLSMVNRGINRAIRYAADSETYGSRDYWADITEIAAKRRGDCEDYAIMKMAALSRLGIPVKNMSVVVLYDKTKRAFHAVLAVATDEGNFILDNNSNDVYADTTRSDYQPLYSVGAGKAWLHGMRVGTVSAMGDIGDLRAIAPGEGMAN